MTSNKKPARVAAGLAFLPALVLAVPAGVALGPAAGVAVFLAVGAALMGWALLGADRRVASGLAALGARDADPVIDARLCNLVEGLSVTAGVPQPRTVVIERPGLNALAAGTKPAKAVIGFTSGLLSELERVELEALVAEAIAMVRHGLTAVPTVVSATFGLGRRRAMPADRDALADQAAVRLTRYPPALACALEKLEAKGCEVSGSPAVLSFLWLADPGPGDPRQRGRLPLRERIEALREL